MRHFALAAALLLLASSSTSAAPSQPGRGQKAKTGSPGKVRVTVEPGAAEVKPAYLDVSGEIRTPDDQPAARAHLFVAAQDPNAAHQPPEVKVDASGKFRGRVNLGVPNVQHVVLTAVLPGEGISVSRVAVTGREARASLKLERGVELSGRVIGLDGKPVPEVEVGVAGMEPDPASVKLLEVLPHTQFLPGEMVWELFRTRTGPDGRFTLRGLPKWGMAHLGIRGDLQLAPGSSAPVMLSRADRQDLGMVVAGRTGKLALRVTEAATGRPLQGVPGVLWPKDAAFSIFGPGSPAGSPQPVQTGSGGVAMVADLLPGDYVLFLQGKQLELAIAPGKTSQQSVRVRTGPLRLRVLDAAGKPVRGLPIVMEQSPGASPLEGSSFFGRRSERGIGATGPGGTFTIKNFPWMADRVTLRASQGNAVAEWSGKPEKLANRLDLRLQPAVRISVVGRLLDPARRPVSAATAVAIRWQEGTRSAWLANSQPVLGQPSGRFRVDGLPRGESFSLLSGSPFGSGASDGGSYETPRFTTATTGAVQDLGDVIVHPLDGPDQILQVYGIESREQLHRLSSLLPAPTAQQVSAAREALSRYDAALTSGNLEAVRRMTSHLGAPKGDDLTGFLLNGSFRTSGIGADREFQPLRMIPRLSMAYLTSLRTIVENPESGFNLGAAGRRLDAEPEWVILARAGDAGIDVGAFLHREGGEWKVVPLTGAGPGATSILLLDNPGRSIDPAGFKKPAALPSEEGAASARRVGERYLQAWAAEDSLNVLKRTSPLATFHAPEIGEFKRRFQARLDRGESPVPAGRETRLELLRDLTQWELERLGGVVRVLSEISGTRRRDAENPDLDEFPKAWASRGDLAPFRYTAGGRSYLMLLARREGQWEVVEPALPLD